MTVLLALGWPLALLATWRWVVNYRLGWRAVAQTKDAVRLAEHWKEQTEEARANAREWEEQARDWEAACIVWQAVILQPLQPNAFRGRVQ